MFLTQEWIQERLSSVWPGWKISRKLGSGTYGSVYEIYRGHPGKEGSGAVLTSALKVLYMEETDPEDPPTVSLLPLRGLDLNENQISGNPIKDYSPLDDYPETAFLEK